jgi:uncharacterized repeat protein (TIGR02543 family)
MLTKKPFCISLIVGLMLVYGLIGCETEDGIDEYTVTFSANGGSGTAPGPMTVQAGSSITLPGGTGLSKTGFTFGGWNTNAYGTGTNYNAGSSYTVYGNVTLYAKWDTDVVGTWRSQTYYHSNYGYSGYSEHTAPYQTTTYTLTLGADSRYEWVEFREIFETLNMNTYIFDWTRNSTKTIIGTYAVSGNAITFEQNVSGGLSIYYNGYIFDNNKLYTDLGANSTIKFTKDN